MADLNVFKKLLDTVDGAAFAGIDTQTAVKLKGGKSNPQQGRVTKLHTGANVMLFTNKGGSSYAKMVERRLGNEGKDPASFELQPRKWGERIPNTPFIEHKGKHYIEVIFLRPGTSQYLLDGKPVDKSEIEGLPSPREAEQGGLDNKVIIRSYSLDSIKAIRIDGTEYKF